MPDTIPLDVKNPTPSYDFYAHYGRKLVQRRLDLATFLPTGNTKYISPTKLPVQQAQIPVVGIIGAGAGGLYAGLMLESLGIKYEILESSDRTGGRLFTYKFTDAPHDYFDVGAMRFPQTNIMTRLFHLFNYRPLKYKGKQLSELLVPYYFTAVKNNAYLYYNGIRRRQNDIGAEGFRAEELDVPPGYINVGADQIMSDAIRPFARVLMEDLTTSSTTGWDAMMRYDSYSTRGFMSTVYRPNPSFNVPPVNLPTQVVNWCETMSNSTGSYDKAFTAMVLDELAFGFDPNPEDTEKVNWFCLDGGSQVLSGAMTQYIIDNNLGSIQLNARVTGISYHDTADPASRMNVRIQGLHDRQYAHVISTVPLTCLRTMDLVRCGLTTKQSNALRELQYSPSTKIGIKFKTAWWTTGTDSSGKVIDITGGQSYSDLPIRTVVYPSYGVGTDTPTTVLIASYCWTEDARRLGALMDQGTDADTQLLKLVLKDLALIHKVSVRFLETQYVDHFAWDWSHSPLTMGAFAFFGPGKFGDLYDSLNVPAANGALHFAGEALSVRHAWVVGALDSAWRAVKEILLLDYKDKIEDFEAMWGRNQEWYSESPDDPHLKYKPAYDLLIKYMVLQLGTDIFDEKLLSEVYQRPPV